MSSGLAKVLRVVAPTLIIVGWLVVGSVGGPYFGRITEVSNNDQASYLPASSQAAEVQALQSEFVDSDAVPAVVLFTRVDDLTREDDAAIKDRLSAVKELTGVDPDGVSVPIPSEDGKAVQAIVPVVDSEVSADVVAELRATINEDLPDGLTGYVTGPAGLSADLSAAFAGIDGLLLLVAISAVLVILIIVYRSPLLPVLVLTSSVMALCASILVVWWLARDGVLSINGQVQGILFILVIGAATDYSLLYVARFREALGEHRSRWQATRIAWRGAVEPILASAGTVVAGLLCLLLSDLDSNRALGPVAAIGIGFALLASLTLLPALLFVAKSIAFWPRRPQAVSQADVEAAESGIWAAVGRFVRRRARVIWIVCVLVLAAAALGVSQFRADGVSQSELVLGSSPARDGQRALAEHFPGGSGSPALIVTAEDALDEIADRVLGTDGVDALAVASDDSPSGSLPVTEDGIGSYGPGPPGEPTTVDGRVLLQATLTSAADSPAAERTVAELRSELADHPRTLVGGVTATAIDTDAAAVHDRNLIIPVALVVISLILMILLRSIIAPLLLMATVVLSLGATVGVAALVFNVLLDFPGADPAVPLYGFVFLVALGIDYNIFLMTRVREEAIGHGTRDGVIRGLMITGRVITSAGIVLAATFAALAVIPVLFLAQLAFIVAFGVLLDTFLVRTLLVPALAHDLGRVIWWPGRKISS